MTSTGPSMKVYLSIIKSLHRLKQQVEPLVAFHSQTKLTSNHNRLIEYLSILAR
jgi:hypothetical protein